MIEALRQYAEKAQNGQLNFNGAFCSEDAVRGFAFVDLCQKRYDVVLMNPPFGEATELHGQFLRFQYPTSRYDLSACFVENGLGRLMHAGRLGAITSRSLYFLGRFEDFRRETLLSKSSVKIFADLGLGVLDAFIDTSLIVLERTTPDDLSSEIVCFDAKHSEIKNDDLRNQTALFRQIGAGITDHSFIVTASHFGRSPLAAFSFWSSAAVLALLDKTNSLASLGVDTCVGLQTDDDERFLRLAWEVPLNDITNDWKYLAKGGEYSKFWDDIHLVINWRNDGQEVKAFVASLFGSASKHVQNERHYFRPGLTYPFRTAKGFNIRCLPKGCIFTLQGMAVFTPGDDPTELMVLLGILNSHFTLYFLKMLTSADAYQVGYVRMLPGVVRDLLAEKAIREITYAAIRSRQSLDVFDETSRLFERPIAVAAGTANLSEAATWASERLLTAQFTITDAIDKINDILAREWFTSEDEAKQILNNYSEPPLEWSACTPIQIVGDCLAWTVGVACGRWNVQGRNAPRTVNGDPFAALMRCSPGMLQDGCDLPARVTPEGYPVSVQLDGILPDDANNPHDIVRKVRAVLDVVWEGRANSIEREACEILCVKELRDYFRRPGKHGFWDDHVSRYSKSRRKAPIYWLLQSSKRNYALWLYYHRLDKDLLFKALVNYVEPKIRLETNHLDTLRSQKAAAGDSGKEAKRLAKEIERQEDFLSELRDFEDKLRRAANLHLEPDLNDGVVLNIAPLRELVPWKEAEEYWEELLKGEYEWSSIGKQLRQKGLVK